MSDNLNQSPQSPELAQATAQSFHGSEIGDEGAKAIADVLRDETTTVKGIDLSGSEVGDESAKAIAKVLQDKTTKKRKRTDEELQEGQEDLEDQEHQKENKEIQPQMLSLLPLLQNENLENQTGDDAIRAMEELLQAEFRQIGGHAMFFEVPGKSEVSRGVRRYSAPSTPMPPSAKPGVKWHELPEHPDWHVVTMAAKLSSWIYDLEINGKDPQSLLAQTLSGAEVKHVVLQNPKEGRLSQVAAVYFKEKDTYFLVWRGTEWGIDWATDASAAFHGIEDTEGVFTGINIHSGIYSLISRDIRQHLSELLAHVETLKPKDVVFCGHSLGGGAAQIALLMAFLSMNGCHHQKFELKEATIRAVTFAAPMTVAYEQRKPLHPVQETIKGLMAKWSWNFMNQNDVVPRLPGCVSYLDNWLKMFPLVCSFINFPFKKLFNTELCNLLDFPRQLNECAQYLHPGNLIHLNPPTMLDPTASSLDVYQDRRNSGLIKDHAMANYITALEKLGIALYIPSDGQQVLYFSVV